MNANPQVSFPLRPYTKKELSLLYFPDATPENAVRHLMSWMRRCTELWQKLQADPGYGKYNRTLSTRQVKLIVYYLGEP